MKKVIAFLFCTASLAACGGPDNVGACQKFVNAVKCGSVDISGTYNCQSFSNTSCDITEYFNCLTSHYVCNNGQYDTAKLSTVNECATKAVCK